MKIRKLMLITVLTLTSTTGFTQEKLEQTLRGFIVDKETQIPLSGVNIILANSNPQQGTISDEKGTDVI